jgi:endogenous inhibitor of DNA gyrase (YacG/DUF329 family)
MTALCPICRRRADLSTLPFCSRRCADVDLGRWLTGQYVIPAHPAEDDEESDGGNLPPLRRVDPS